MQKKYLWNGYKLEPSYVLVLFAVLICSAFFSVFNASFFNCYGFNLWGWLYTSCNLITSSVIKEGKKNFYQKHSSCVLHIGQLMFAYCRHIFISNVFIVSYKYTFSFTWKYQVIVPYIYEIILDFIYHFQKVILKENNSF